VHVKPLSSCNAWLPTSYLHTSWPPNSRGRVHKCGAMFGKIVGESLPTESKLKAKMTVICAFFSTFKNRKTSRPVQNILPNVILLVNHSAITFIWPHKILDTHVCVPGVKLGRIPPDFRSGTSYLRSITSNLGSTTAKWRSSTLMLESTAVKLNMKSYRSGRSRYKGKYICH